MKVSTLTALESPTARIQQLARQTFVYGAPLSLDEMTGAHRRDQRGRRPRGRRGDAESAPTVAAIGGSAR